MRNLNLVSSAIAIALAMPLTAQAADAAASADSAEAPATGRDSAAAAPRSAPASQDMISTGVAKGRDRLDSAVSTSTLRQDDVDRLAARNIGQILHSIAGVRAGDTLGDGNADITVRGLPLTSSGAKYLQLQEDGLPVLEFGDMIGGTSDLFLRYDLNVNQIEAIRGGSASTFASNSPAGIINFISRTGTTAGGTLQVSSGINYDEKRIDFEYGRPIDQNTRFHIGGYWHQGAGPRDTGYNDAVLGGQIKLNITHDLPIGYIRLYAKLLDDRAPMYIGTAMKVSGSDASPTYLPLSGTNPGRDTVFSPYTSSVLQLSPNGQVITEDMRKGQHGISKSLHLESQLNFDGWTVTERFRYASQSGDAMASGPLLVAPAADFANTLGATSLVFANGPKAGQQITNPATQLGADGVLVMADLTAQHIRDIGNITNDLRVSRVWDVNGGELTGTAGFYTAHQAFNTQWTTTDYVVNAVGHGQNVMIDLIGPNGPLTQNGVYAYYDPIATQQGTRVIDVNYVVNAGFGSLNYHIGKLAIGASVRYDFGSGKGTIWGNELAPGGTGYGTYPIVPGSTAQAGNLVALPPLAWSAPVNYTYHYVSYSTGVNYRLADDYSVFARYSRGGRANADRMLFTPLLDTTTGGLTSSAGAVDTVRQAEAGFKVRKRDYLLNVTAFWAKTRDYDAFFGPLSIRDYTAYGAELEGEVHHGPWAVAANATYTHARVTTDATTPANNGKVPQQQPTWILNVVPHYDQGIVSVGGYVSYVSRRYAGVTNELVLPAYTTVNPYVQVRPTKALSVMVNVYNLFDTMGITTAPGSIAATNSGYAPITTIQGRSMTGSIKLLF